MLSAAAVVQVLGAGAYSRLVNRVFKTAGKVVMLEQLLLATYPTAAARKQYCQEATYETDFAGKACVGVKNLELRQTSTEVCP